MLQDMFQGPAVSNVCQVIVEAYSESCPISKIGLFEKIVHDFNP